MTSPMERPRPDNNTATLPPASSLRHLAAIDLGSNSFHFLIAQVRDGQLQIVARHGDKVQLAAGLDDTHHLDEAAIQRALTSLSRFLPLLEQVDRRHLRVVGTSALRTARNRDTFIARAEALLGCRIEVISGEEEARLIYLGAAQALDESGQRLVIDIGGGSTEFIIGNRLQPLITRSLDVGCVTHTRRHFSDGVLSEARMRQAEEEMLIQLERIRPAYRQLGWSETLGTSGTIQAAATVLADGGGPPALITRAGLQALRQRVITYGHLDRLILPGLKPDRSSIFPAGIAMLTAIFDSFELTTLRFADGALREGVLHDMLGRSELRHC